jgi:hypothetical protein
MEAKEIAGGSAITIAAVKDSAFGLIHASIAAEGSADGVKVMRLAGDIPSGNSGSPVVDSQGSVIGLLVEMESDGKPLFIMYPAAYVLALDSTLPTQPWKPGNAAPVTAGPAAGTTPPQAGTNDAADAGIASALTSFYDMYFRTYYLAQNIFAISKYSTFNNAVFYSMQSEVTNAQTQCDWLKSNDPLRGKLIQAASQILARQKTALDYCVQCNLLNNETPRNHPEQAKDFAQRAFSTLAALPDQVALLKPDILALSQSSPQFSKALPVEMQYLLGVIPRKSRLDLGVFANPRNPRILMQVTVKGLAGELDFRGGDRIDSVGGREIKDGDDIEDFKLLIEANLGKTLDAVINRNGKQRVIQMKIPAQMPSKFLRTQNSPPWP